jgi:hypothetical protein
MHWIAPSEKDSANSASDARSYEQELRRQLIESRAADVTGGGPSMFAT